MRTYYLHLLAIPLPTYGLQLSIDQFGARHKTPLLPPAAVYARDSNADLGQAVGESELKFPHKILRRHVAGYTYAFPVR